MCALTLGVRDPGSRRGLLQRRGWALKLLCWAGLVALCFLPSNTVVEHYFQAARAGGAMFLLLQLIIILDAVVTFNEDCLERDDPCSRAKLIAGASACNAGAIAGVACMYVYLWHTDRNLAFITGTCHSAPLPPESCPLLLTLSRRLTLSPSAQSPPASSPCSLCCPSTREPRAASLPPAPSPPTAPTSAPWPS